MNNNHRNQYGDIMGQEIPISPVQNPGGLKRGINMERVHSSLKIPGSPENPTLCVIVPETPTHRQTQENIARLLGVLVQFDSTHTMVLWGAKDRYIPALAQASQTQILQQNDPDILWCETLAGCQKDLLWVIRACEVDAMGQDLPMATLIANLIRAWRRCPDQMTLYECVNAGAIIPMHWLRALPMDLTAPHKQRREMLLAIAHKIDRYRIIDSDLDKYGEVDPSWPTPDHDAVAILRALCHDEIVLPYLSKHANQIEP
ncbi:MAG: hypothetical protein AAF352_00280 [Pseudomonadota bacterium]